MEQYINKALEGDTFAYEYIVREYQTLIFRYINKMIQDPEGAEEVTQDVFITGFYNLIKYDNTYTLKTWFYKIAKNLTLNYIKKQKRHYTLIDRIKLNTTESSTPLDLDHTQNYSDEIVKALSHLKAEEKNLLLLKSVEELTYKDLSLIYEVKESTIRKRYERTRKKFKTFYTEGSHSLCQN